MLPLKVLLRLPFALSFCCQPMPPAGAAHAAAGFVQGCLIAVVVFVSADACGGRIAVVEADGKTCVETQFAPVAEVFIGAGVE